MPVTLLFMLPIYKIHAMAAGSRTSSPESAAQAALPSWVPWILPSSADLIFIAFLILLTCTPLSGRLLGDAGIGWHIRAGQEILATHKLPRIDSFSSSMQGKPWFAWEWLYDAAAGWLDARAGLNGVTWLTAAMIGAVFGWTFQLLHRRGTHLAIALVLTLLAAAASMIHFLARPHVVSWLLTLAWFWILDETEPNAFDGQAGLRRRTLWALPFLMLLWVNLHGGFLLGFTLIAIFCVGSGWTWFNTREGRIEEALQKIAAAKRARTLLWVGLVSAAASLINPYGWKLHGHVYSYLSNRFLMNHIEEFQSPNFHGVAQRCFLALLLVSITTLAFWGRDLRVSHTFTALLAVAMGLYSSRNIPISSILLVIIVGPRLPRRILSEGFFQRMSSVESQQRGHLWPIFAAALTLAIPINGGRVGSRQFVDVHFDPNRMPVTAVQYLGDKGFHGPVFAPDYWGGYVIYRLYPKTLVVVDDRHDFYGAGFFQSYLRIMHVEPGWEELLEQYDPGVILLPRKAALANVLLRTEGWRVIYTDDLSVIFAHKAAGPAEGVRDVGRSHEKAIDVLSDAVDHVLFAARKFRPCTC